MSIALEGASWGLSGTDIHLAEASAIRPVGEAARPVRNVAG
jgi:hypothetical protein